MTKTENSKSTKASKAQTETVKQPETVKQVEPTVVPVEDKKTKKTSKKEETTVSPVTNPVEEKKFTKTSKKEETPAVTVTPVTAPVEEKKSKKTSKKEETPTASVSATVTATVEEKKSKKTSKKEQVVEVKETEEVEGDDQTGGKKRKRYFRCVYRSKAGEIVHAGRYSGKKPKQAARKALTRIADKNSLNIGESVTFLIQECTRGSRKKKYSYTGSRVNLPEPVTVNIAKKDKDGNKTGEFSPLTYKRDNVVKKISLKECGLENVDLGEDVDEVEEPVVKVKKATKKSASKKVSKKASTKKTTSEQKVETKTETKKTKSK